MKQEKNNIARASARLVIVISAIFILAGILQTSITYAGGGGSNIQVVSSAPDFVISVQSGVCFGSARVYALEYGDITTIGVDRYEVPLFIETASSTAEDLSFPCGSTSSTIAQSFTLSQPVTEKVEVKVVPTLISCGEPSQAECDELKESLGNERIFFDKPLIEILPLSETYQVTDIFQVGTPFILQSDVIMDPWGHWLDTLQPTSSTVYAVENSTFATTTFVIGDTGKGVFTFATSGLYTLFAEKKGYKSTYDLWIITVEDPPVSVDMHLRYHDIFLFDGTVEVPPKKYIVDSKNVMHPVAVTPNVLIALKKVDVNLEEFSITKLDYYDAYKSFFLDCITIETPTSTLACGNWNYVVDGKYPSVGMDSYTLKGGEQVYVYFGTPWQITASTSTFSVNTTTTFSTWRYNYNSTSTERAFDGGDTIDISVTNPSPAGWWDATVTTTTLLSNAQGQADYIFSATGTYYAKITSSDFSKWSNSITLNVIDTPVVATSTATSTPSGGHDSGGGSGGGTGGGGSVQQVSSATIEDTVKKILDFFALRQSADGRVVDAGTTDWAIMSFGAHSSYANDIAHTSSSLLQFIENDTSLGNEANVCTAYARRVLALRAAGIPADDAHVAPHLAFLIAHCGAEGDKNLPEINDDIFVALALNASGADSGNAIMKGLHDAIAAAQDRTTGAFIAWGSPAPDMTGAAINALKTFGSSASDNAAIASAKQYLHSTQLTDGGWNTWDASSDYITTAWVMMGINALGEGQSEWVSASGKTPWHVMTEKLNAKGYYESPWDAEGIDWFGTKNAVPALIGKSWPIILAPKSQPISPTSQSVSVGGGGSNVNIIGSGSASSNDSTQFVIASSTLVNVPLPATIFASSSVPLSQVQSTSTLVLSNNTDGSLPPRRRFESEGDDLIDQNISSSGQEFSDQGVESRKVLSASPEKDKDPLLPIKKRVAESAATGSAAVFAGTSVLLILRLLLAAL